MPILGSFSGARGFGRHGFKAWATGGIVSQYNGYTYHRFETSGTFTAPDSSKFLWFLLINGGAAGGNSSADNSGSYGGNGGAGGTAQFRSRTTSGTFTVTVPGAGGTAAVGITTTLNATQVGGAGGAGSKSSSQLNGYAATSGGSVSLINTRGTPWTFYQLNKGTNSGGGGGGSYQLELTGSFPVQDFPPASGGSGGYNTDSGGGGAGNGVSAAPNTGGGGGGAYMGSTTTNYVLNGSGDPQGPGNGGSGIVIIAYES